MSVYATLTMTKVQAFLSLSFRRSSLRSAPHKVRARFTTFGNRSGALRLPLKKKSATLHCQSRPKRRTKWQMLCWYFFPPVVLDYLNVSKFRFISETISCFISFIVFSEIWYSDVLWNLSLLGRNNVYASTPSASAIFSANLRDGHLRPISI